MGFNGKMSAITFIIEFTLFGFFLLNGVRSYTIAQLLSINSIYTWSLFILLFLSLYQFSEVAECKYNITTEGKIFGHVVITMLPVFGFFLTHAMGVKTYNLEYLTLAFGLLFSVNFIKRPKSVDLIECSTHFVKYNYNSDITQYYGLYYNGSLFVVMVLLIMEVLKHDIVSFSNPILLLLVGYILFTFPTLLSVLMKKISTNYVTSVMCQWALFLALVLSWMLYSNFIAI